MTELARKLCDELLGKDRNKIPGKNNESSDKRPAFMDEKVCPYFLAGFCPYEQFLNTKSDIGRCPFKDHEESSKKEYLLHTDDRYMERVERQCIQLFQKLISDLDRKIQRGKGRLDIKATDDVLQLMKPNKDVNEERVAILEVQLKGCVEKMEIYIEEGRIADAQELNQQAERIRSDIHALKDEINPIFKQEKQMEVCEICGALLVMDPSNGHRVDVHFEGKQHIGYAKIREQLKLLSEKYEKRAKRESRSVRYYDETYNGSDDAHEHGRGYSRHTHRSRSRSKSPGRRHYRDQRYKYR